MKVTSAARQRARSGPEPVRSAAGPQLSIRTPRPSILASEIQIASPAFSAPLKSMPMTRLVIDLLAQQLERGFERCKADRLAVAVELMTLDHRFSPSALAGEIDQADRLRRRRASWAGDASHGHGHVGRRAGERPLDHGARRMRAH